MSQEIEFKFGVDDEQALDRFARVLGFALAEHAPRTQRNTFFDSADGRLRARGLALRLRIENGQGVLTVKGKGTPRSRDGALLARFEAERSIDLERAQAILVESLSPLEALADSGDPTLDEGLELLRAALADAELTSLGGFENERTTLPAVELEVEGHTQQLVFELDRTTFPGGRVDCEIEAEIGPEVEAAPLMRHLSDLLERAEVDWRPAPSKLARFMEALASDRTGRQPASEKTDE